MRRSSELLFNVALLTVVTGFNPVSLFAQTSYIYANNGDPTKTKASYVYKIDLSNGNIVDTYNNLDATSIDGRGVVVVGSVMYYTASTSNCIFLYDLIMGPVGCVGHIAAESGLGSLAYDGTNLWVVGASNKIYECNRTLNCVVAFTQPCSALQLGCDALEYFTTPGAFSGGALVTKDNIAPPGDYDVYSLTGAPLVPSFLHPSSATDTGVAWDGTYFYTADNTGKQLQQFSSSGSSTGFIAISGLPPVSTLEDLSINYGTLPCHNPVGPGLASPKYDNGPINGQTNAWSLSFGDVVSNSFVIGPVGSPAKTITSACLGLWSTHDSLIFSVDWSITVAPNSGVPIASGTANFTDLSNLFYLFTSNVHICQPPSCDVYQAIMPLPGVPPLLPGTYFLNLSNGISASGDPVLWDENNGVNCRSKGPGGCPSTALHFDSLSCSAGCPNPSESLTIR